MKDLQPFLGDVVRELRLDRGLNQINFAVKTGLDQRTLNKIENGGTNFQPMSVAKISRNLKMPIAEILRLAKERKQEAEKGTRFQPASVASKVTKKNSKKSLPGDYRFSSKQAADFLRSYYQRVKVPGPYKWYDLNVEGMRIDTSMVVSTAPRLQNYELQGGNFRTPSALKRHMSGYRSSANLNEDEWLVVENKKKEVRELHERRGTVLWSDDTYRLVDVEVGMPCFKFEICDYLEDYRWTSGLLEDELKYALHEIDSGRSASGLFPLREILIPSPESLFDLRRRFCCGGVNVAIAFKRGNEFLVPLQVRSRLVGDSQGSLALVPKGIHQPSSSDARDVQPYWTVLKEMYEEFYLGESVKKSTEHVFSDWWLNDEKAAPIRYLLGKPGSFDIHGLSFGFNMVSGNFEFGCLVIVHDESFLGKFPILPDWETEVFEMVSTLDKAALVEYLSHPEFRLVNECLPTFARSLMKLNEVSPDLLNVEWLTQY